MNFELTDNEATVALYLIRGLSDKAIAKQANLSVLAVKTRLRRIYRKLKVANRTQAALLLNAPYTHHGQYLTRNQPERYTVGMAGGTAITERVGSNRS